MCDCKVCDKCPLFPEAHTTKEWMELKIERDTPDIPTLLTSSKIKGGSRGKREAKDDGFLGFWLKLECS